MAELSRFFNSEVGDVREYPASDFAEYFDKFLSDGIYTDNDSMGLNTTITGLVATVGEGFAFIKGYLYKNDADITFTLSNADAILSRIDRLVLKLDTVNRSMNVIKKEGALGSNPVAPTLIDNVSIKELPLVQIRVNATSSTGIITDERIPVSSISITTADMVIDTASKVLMLPSERIKLNGIATNAQVNAVTTVAGKTGDVVIAKADVGLGSVENYAKASQAEAEAGTSDVKYMTPLRTKQAIGNGSPRGSGSVAVAQYDSQIIPVTHNLGRHAIIQYWGSSLGGGSQNNYISDNTDTSFTIKLTSDSGYVGVGTLYYEYW